MVPVKLGGIVAAVVVELVGVVAPQNLCRTEDAKLAGTAVHQILVVHLLVEVWGCVRSSRWCRPDSRIVGVRNVEHTAHRL